MSDSTKDDKTTRRDFLYITTGAFGAVGAAAVAWPLIDQLNPDASVKAVSTIEVDISSIDIESQRYYKIKKVFLNKILGPKSSKNFEEKIKNNFKIENFKKGEYPFESQYGDISNEDFKKINSVIKIIITNVFFIVFYININFFFF